MATIALTALTPNTNTAAPSQTASGSTNTITLGSVPPEEVLIKAVVTTATTNVTIKAGTYPPALSQGQGDTVLALTVGTHYIGPFTSARYLKSDAASPPTYNLGVDVATSANVTLAALRIPRTA